MGSRGSEPLVSTPEPNASDSKATTTTTNLDLQLRWCPHNQITCHVCISGRVHLSVHVRF
jgi:hypothetical protein